MSIFLVVSAFVALSLLAVGPVSILNPKPDPNLPYFIYTIACTIIIAHVLIIEFETGLI